MTIPEAKVKSSWIPLEFGAGAPRVHESSKLELRGFAANELVEIGVVQWRADFEGCIKVSLSQCKELQGHLGYVEVWRENGLCAGEIFVVPDKMSAAAYEELRADLERIWVGLIFDPQGIGSLPAKMPDPQDLWRAIESPLRDIAAEPRTVLDRGVGMKRLEAVRRPKEISVSVLRASASLAQLVAVKASAARHPSARGKGGQLSFDDLLASRAQPLYVQRPGRCSTIERRVDVPENALVAETLRRLAAYSRRHPKGREVASRATKALDSPPFSICGYLTSGLESARLRTRHDSRYRRIDSVLRILDRPEAHATEGPGEARMGVEGIIRLYEYWVFLQVLIACSEKYGPPQEPGFSVLSEMTQVGTTKLTIPNSATVTFNSDVHVGFEPEIFSSGLGWQGLENVPHPDNRKSQNRITPDVVVFRSGEEPSAVVFDAKYVGRPFVEFAAAKIHAAYSRMRLRGVPVVRNVFAVHPHIGIDFHWAGYGSIPLVPGKETDLTPFLP